MNGVHYMKGLHAVIWYWPMFLQLDMDTSLRSRILGEAKFLRAWYYFTLINIFGDVPIVLTPLTSKSIANCSVTCHSNLCISH